MESLEITVLPIVLIGALLIGAIWTNVLVHWLRSTRAAPVGAWPEHFTRNIRNG